VLVPGENYKFKVQARNAVGYGSFSEEITIRAAKIPEMPISVTTQVDVDNVIVSWVPDYDGGSPIFAYKILTRESDGETFTEDLVNCNGSEQTIVDGDSCTVPISALKADPYSLIWGASIYAKVKAINLVGESEYSLEGNGAVILTTPNAP
jgi:hypothetical protein